MRIDRTIDSSLVEMDLAELTRERALTQEVLAKRLDLAQGNVSRALHRSDMRISTLRAVVTAMGGQLEVLARFGDRTVRIIQFDEGSGKQRGKSGKSAKGGSASGEATVDGEGRGEADGPSLQDAALSSEVMSRAAVEDPGRKKKAKKKKEKKKKKKERKNSADSDW
jgi:hypothetical protein